MQKEAGYWIEKLELEEHPEGGFFRRTYRSSERVAAACLPERFGGPRIFSSAIYYLLPGDRVSAFHRIKSDEMWHFYTGAPLVIYALDESGTLSTTLLGRNFERGETFQALVRAGLWFGAAVSDPESFSLIGCTVAPGFEFEDFELARRDDLLTLYPEHCPLIQRLTR
jgi:uncharacterized protein